MRAQTIIEHLRQQHEVVVLTFGQALEMLHPIYAGTEVQVRDIGGMYLEYNRWGRMSPTKTLLLGLPYALRMPRLVRQLRDELRIKRAALVISDFEPVSMRAASAAGIPVLSIDHQRYLETCRLDQLPSLQRLKIWGMNFVIRRIYGVPDQMVVSGFHLPELKRAFRHVHTAGVLLRDEVRLANIRHGEHLVVYLRRNCPQRVLDVLHESALPVHVYGLGRRESRGLVEFRQVSPSAFVEDLASSKALITTAGNQLIGEALYLLKPVLAFPEPGNFEQQINGHLLNESGGGRAVSHREFSQTLLQDFLGQLDSYRAQIKRDEVSGNEKIFGLLDQHLGARMRAQTQPPTRATRTSADGRLEQVQQRARVVDV